MPSAIVFTQPDQVELQNYESLALQPGEVRIECEFSGVSQGTEIWALQGKRRELQFPTMPGYQSVGRIIELGPDVTGVSLGDRLLYHSSRQPDTLTETWMGGHPSDPVVSLNEGTRPQCVPEAAEPRTAAIAAMPAVAEVGHSMIDIAPGDLIVVIGQGLIGQCSAMFAKLRGGVVVTADLSATRRDLSKRHSADVVVDPTKQSLDAVVHDLRPDGADVVIDTTGRSAMFQTAVDLLRRRGRIVLQGWYPDAIQFDFHQTHLKLPTIATPCGIGDTAKVLNLLALGRLDWGPLITDTVSPLQAGEIYRQLSAGTDQLGVVFDWSQL